MYFNGNNLILILKTFKVIYFGNPNRTPRDDMGTGTPGDVRLSFPKPQDSHSLTSRSSFTFVWNC